MKTCSTCNVEKPDGDYYRYNQCKACRKEKIYAWRAANPDKVRAIKQKFYSSEKGIACKKREESAYSASGGRAATEDRRKNKPLSEARKLARKKWAEKNQAYFTANRSKRRALERNLTTEEFWILQEAVELCRLREKLLGGAWHVDHIIPVSKGGDSRPNNLQVVPALWNRRKSNVHTERFFGAAA